MDLSTAKEEFYKILRSTSKDARTRFISWLQDSDVLDGKEESDIIMEGIAEDIRNKVDLTAVLPTEKLFQPVAGEVTQNIERTKHVDMFLYSDDFIDDLVDQGKFSRNYCTECGSENTKPFEFISHSSSVDELKTLFTELLPTLMGKSIIDIGSRLGPVLYAAHFFSDAKKIIGIELNDELCDIQKEIIEKYKMSDKVSVVCKDVKLCGDILSKGDVIVMNNVFEYFTSPHLISTMWKFIMTSLCHHGQLIVTYPSLQESLETVQMASQLEGWVTEEEFENNDTDFHIYRVI